MFSRIKRIVLPVSFAVGRLVSSAGSALFGIQNVIKYFSTSDAKSPVNLTVEVITLFANTWINSVTRVPALFNQFSPATQVESNPKEEAPSCCINSKSSLRDASIVVSFKIIGIINGLFTANGSYLGGITLAEFIGLLANTDVHDEPWKENLIQSIALYLALCNFAVFYSYNLTRIEKNAKKLAEHLNSEEHWDRTVILKTLGVTSAGLVSGAMLGYFSTSRALAKIPFINIPENVKSGLSSVAAMAGFSSASMTYLPAIYQNLMLKSLPSQAASFACESTIKWSSYMVGLVDAGATGMQNFIGVVNTSHDIVGVDPKDYYVIIPAGICGVSTAISHFVFNVKVGVDDFVNKRIIAKQNYLPLPTGDTIDKLEKGLLQKNSLFSSSDKPTLNIDIVKKDPIPEIDNPAMSY